MMPIGDVKPYANNPRNNKNAVAKVAASLEEFGFRQPIVVDKDNVVIAGHTRLLAAKRLKMKEVPVLVADDLTDEQVKAYRLADNKTAEFAEWDFDKLDEELAGIGDIDMEAFGFDLSAEDEEPEVVEDDFDPDLPDEPKAKRGDIYQLGRHRLMCGDSTSIDDVMALCDGEPIDLLLTDPPYNVNYEGTAGKIENDNMEDEQFRAFLRDAFVNARTVLRPGAAFHIWHADSEGYNFRGACRDAGLTVRQCLIWVKNSLVLGRQDFQWQHEPCLYGERLPDELDFDDEPIEVYNDVDLYGWKDGASHSWYSNRKQTTLLYFDRPTASREHPTMKPIKLFDYEMKCNTQAGDAVLDLFGGSGTTIMAAEQNGRNAFVMEFDPKFVDVIIERWEQFTGEQAVLLNGDDE